MDADPRGEWPAHLPPLVGGGIEEGLQVLSISGRIEGRTTGSRRRCSSTGCPGWFIGVRWETGQLMFICSEGWRWHPGERVIRVHDGGEISARFVSPKPMGTPPLPEEQWPERSALRKWAGWRVKRSFFACPGV